MSIRKDVYQLDIQILTEETKKLGKINTEMKALKAELRKTEKAGGDTSDVLRRMAATGKQIEDLDLSKVAPQQLITRSRALATAMKQIPESTPAFKAMEAEQKKINDRLATMRSRTRGVADATDAADSGVKKFGNGLKSLMATGLVAIIALIGSALVKFKDFALGVSDLSEEIELMDRKAERVFGDMEGYVGEFAAANAESLGVTERRYKDVAAAIQDVLVPLGFSRDLAAEMSITTANLGGKLAEWAGASIDAEDATERVRKALLGERESLEALGIKIDEAAIKRKLQERGLEKLTGASLDQAKALATLELIQEKSNDATTQFGENQDTAARATARNKAQIEAQREEMAERALPILNAAKLLYYQLLNAVLSVTGGFFNWIQRLREAAAQSESFQKIAGVAFGFVIGQVKSLLAVLGGIGNAMVSVLEGEWRQALTDVGEGFKEAGRVRAEAIKIGFEEGISGFTPELPEPKEFKDTDLDFNKQYADLLTGSNESSGSQTNTTEEKIEQEEKREELRIEMLKTKGIEEIDLIRSISDEKGELIDAEVVKMAQAEAQKRAEIEATNSMRKKTNDEAVAATGKMFGSIADLLDKAAGDQKRFKQTIKALRISEILMNSYLEISKIWATYAGNPIVAVPLTIAAGARAAAGVANVAKAQRGGMFGVINRGVRMAKQGIFGGNLHSNGGNRGVFQDGTEIEVERDELFMVVNRRSTDLIKQMGGLNAINGYGIDFSKGVSPGRRAERGSLMSFNTTPRGSARVASADAQGTNLNGIMDAVMTLIEEQRMQNMRPIKTYVALDDFEAKQGDRDFVASRAAL